MNIVRSGKASPRFRRTKRSGAEGYILGPNTGSESGQERADDKEPDDWLRGCLHYSLLERTPLGSWPVWACSGKLPTV